MISCIFQKIWPIFLLGYSTLSSSSPSPSSSNSCNVTFGFAAYFNSFKIDMNSKVIFLYLVTEMGVPNLSFRNPKQPHCLWDFLCGQESKPILPPYKPRWYCFRIWHDTMIHITSKSKKTNLIILMLIHFLWVWLPGVESAKLLYKIFYFSPKVWFHPDYNKSYKI